MGAESHRSIESLPSGTPDLICSTNCNKVSVLAQPLSERVQLKFALTLSQAGRQRAVLPLIHRCV